MSNKRFVYSSEEKHKWHRNNGKLRRLNRVFDLIDSERGVFPRKVETFVVNNKVNSEVK
jgi:hypothetical protein